MQRARGIELFAVRRGAHMPALQTDHFGAGIGGND